MPTYSDVMSAYSMVYMPDGNRTGMKLIVQ